MNISRNQRNGAVLVRCSQPEIGFFNWRNTEDENLMKAFSGACEQNPGKGQKKTLMSEDSSGSESGSQSEGLQFQFLFYRNLQVYTLLIFLHKHVSSLFTGKIILVPFAIF